MQQMGTVSVRSGFAFLSVIPAGNLLFIDQTETPEANDSCHAANPQHSIEE
jgi:hypothetical protein